MDEYKVFALNDFLKTLRIITPAEYSRSEVQEFRFSGSFFSEPHFYSAHDLKFPDLNLTLTFRSINKLLLSASETIEFVRDKFNELQRGGMSPLVSVWQG